MTMFSVRKNLGRVVVAVAFTFAITFTAFAQEFTGKVPTVPATNAPTVLVEKSAQHMIPAERGLPVEIGLFELSNDKAAAAIRTATDLGPAPADLKMGMQLVLRRSSGQEEALRVLIQRTMDPHDPLYGTTMTPKEFAQTFGLSSTDLETVRGWLALKGFTVGNVDNGRMTINFEGTAAQVKAAFHTEIHLYQAADGSQHYANANAPQLPDEFSLLIGKISGLENFSVLSSRGFDGPVTDFAEGTVGEPTPVGTAPKNAPAVIRDGEALHDASFTASKLSMQLGDSAQLNVRLGGNSNPATGSLLITDQNGKDVAYISDITTCEPYNNGYGRSCNVTFKPTAPGSYDLKATYSGDKNERGVEQMIHSNATGTQTTYAVLTPAPTGYSSTAGFGSSKNGVLTATVSWTATGTVPSGTLTFIEDGDGRSLGTAILPVPPATTSSGTSTPYTGTSAYSCTTNTTDMISTCTVTDSNIWLTLPYNLGPNDLQVTYPGDSNYASSPGYTQVYAEYGRNGTGAPIANVASIVQSGTLTAATYGATQAETATVTVTGNATYAGEGFLIFDNGTFAFLQVVGNGALGTMETYTSECATATSCVLTVPFTVPAVVTPATYNVTYAYSGNTYWAGTDQEYFGLYGPSNSTTYSLTVNKQTPTFGTMTFTPSSVVQGQNQAVVISDTLAWTGIGALPTNVVTYTLNAVGYTATCTGMVSPYTCTATVPGATIAALATGNYTVTAAAAADTNYAAATGTSGTFVVGNIGSGLTATPSSQVYGSGSSANTGTTVALVDTISITTGNPAPTGTVTFTNSAGVTAIGSVAITACTTSTSGTLTLYTCTYNWTVPAGVSGDNAGTYTVTATLPANGPYATQTATAGVVISKDGTATTLSANPNSITATSTNTVFTSVTTWNAPGNGLSPTGTVTITCGAGSPSACTNLPAAMNVTSCTTSVAARTITCTFPTYDVYDNILDYGVYNFTATYSGDVNYSTSAGIAPVTVNQGVATTTTPSVTSGSPVTYGSGTSVVFSVVVAGVSGDGAPTGTLTLTNPTLGTMATVTTSTCTATNSYTYTCSVTYPVPAATAVGSYTVTATYGGGGPAFIYTGSSGTTSFTVAKQTPTMGTMSFSPAASEPYGTNQAITISDTLIYTGSGAVPTGAVTYVLNAVTYTASCTGSSSPLTCTATVPGATIAALAVNGYTVTAAYAGNTNYNSATGASGTFTITKATTTSAMTSPTSGSPVTQTTGSLTAFTVTGTVSWSGSGTAPTSSDITFSSTAAGTMGAASCSGATSPYTCTALFTPTGTDTAGNYNINIAFSGDTNYSSSASTQVGNYIIVAPPDIQFSSVTHNMGSVAIGNSTTYGVHVTNTTAAAIPFTAITISTSASPNPFTSANNCGASVPVAGCEIVFTYAPVAGDSGTQTATWSMTGTAGGTTFGPSNGGTLTGTVAASGNVTITTAGHNFGNVTVGTTSPTYGTVITNSTNAAVTLTLGSVTSPFASVTNCPTTLGAGVSCNLNFTFHPTATGLVQQMYSISVNGGAIPLLVGGNPTTGVTLTGTGD